MVTLRAGDLLLRPWDVERDLDTVVAAQADPDIQLWNGGSTDPEAVRARLVRLADWSDDTHASFAVVAPSREVWGSVSLHAVNRTQLDGHIGYWAAPAARGRGVVTRAVREVCRYAFDDLGLLRLEIYHAVENVASGRVAEKAGFRREGRLRQSWLCGDGVKHDEFLWARLASDPDPAAASATPEVDSA
jgi:RimJ/RimL family protein N-acetyltransferase